MEKMNLKVLFSIFIIFIMFFAPLTFEIYPDESAYAMSRGGGKRKNKRAHIVSKDNKVEKDEKGQNEGFGEYIFVEQDNTAGVQTPEPATLLLLGGGAAGLIALRRKFKK